VPLTAKKNIIPTAIPVLNIGCRIKAGAAPAKR